MHCVLELEAFEADLKRNNVSDELRHQIICAISCDPQGGDVIQGTGGARKMRFPFKSKGKRGGIRVVWYYAGEDVPVYLLAMFAKGEKINLTKSERNELRKELSGIASDYRNTAKDRIAELKRKVS